MKKHKVISGLYDADGLITEYNSIDFYIRKDGKDVKVTTRKFGRQICYDLNRASGQMVAILVTKHTSKKFNSKGVCTHTRQYEIEDDRLAYELSLKYGTLLYGEENHSKMDRK